MRLRFVFPCGFMFLLLCVTTAVAAPATVLPDEIAKALRKQRFSPKGFSVVVQAVDSGEALLAVQAEDPRNPASVIKLLTTAVALDVLGPAYTWKTEVYADGSLESGTLHGDLYIKGYGDPYMVPEYFWRFLRDVSSAGVRHIQGDVVIDDSYFTLEQDDPSAFDGQPTRSYNVIPSALLVNFQTMRFHFRPEAGENKVAVDIFPSPATVQIDNRLRLTREACGYWQYKIAMQVKPKPNGALVQFTGRYPLNCGVRYLYRVVTDAPSYLEGMFRELWLEQGGQFSGKMRAGILPAHASLIHRGESLPLAEIVRGINKFSNNVMARQVLLTLGAEKIAAPGTQENGGRVVESWLRDNGIKGTVALDNGAGLSRQTRISARQLASVLWRVYQKPIMPEFMSSMPINATDGTMSHRLQEPGIAGRMHIKTGSLDNVRSLAGYVLSRGGRRYVVVVLHNDRRANTYEGEHVHDAVLRWVYNR